MPWDYTSPDSIPVRTTTTLNVDRVVAGRLTIIFAEKVIFFQLDRGPISGSGVDKKDEITYNPVEASYEKPLGMPWNESFLVKPIRTETCRPDLYPDTRKFPLA
jgi:hypothetical protein